MFKRVILLFTLLLTLSTTFFAIESKAAEKVDSVGSVELVDSLELVDSGEISPQFINDIRYRKKNVTTSYEWSGFKRVSDDLTTGKGGGSIEATKGVDFDTTISGDINGLGISTSRTVSSSIGYTLIADPNTSVYMGYRVYYKVEKGTREQYDLVTGKVLKSNSYTVKTPQHGDYKLITVR